ncbi:MAG TPA: transcriptional regulator [Xanthobacteraceae bacterium]|jgi:hypothetical protein|nr:transcriptional regulator [Xanthobacteraceae bacterium]
MPLEHSHARDGVRYAFTIAEFCETHRVSKSWLYQEWAAGRGPRVKKIGTKNIITIESAAEWRRAETTDHAA